MVRLPAPEGGKGWGKRVSSQGFTRLQFAWRDSKKFTKDSVREMKGCVCTYVCAVWMSRGMYVLCVWLEDVCLLMVVVVVVV